MKRQLPWLGLVFVVLAALALRSAEEETLRGASSVVLLFAAVLFWKASRRVS